MLMPKKVKYKKMFKGRRRSKGKACRKVNISFGSFGLKAQEHGWVTSRQIEAARRAITKFLKKGGKIWIRIFPINQLQKKELKYLWEEARDRLIIMWQWLNPA